MKKITVKHYLNKRLKSSPIYVRVIYDRKDTNFPSEIVSDLHVSEDDFLNNSKLQQEMQYEKEIVASIIRFYIGIYNDRFSLSKINISSLIHDWKRGLSLIYEDLYISNKQSRASIRKPILKLIANKLDIEEDIIDGLVGYNIDTDVLSKISNRLAIYSEDISNRFIIFQLLEEFENINYGDMADRSFYGANNTFNYFEWAERKVIDNFTEFAISKKILSDTYLKEHIHEFDIKLKDYFKDILFFSSFSDTERHPK
ncbi:MAG: hypothetical protein QM654_13980 [Dysgonamonadaceae bacterium]